MTRFHEIIRTLIDKHLADPGLADRIDILAPMLNSDPREGRAVDYQATGKS